MIELCFLFGANVIIPIPFLWLREDRYVLISLEPASLPSHRKISTLASRS
jgi:hypothetical protein